LTFCMAMVKYKVEGGPFDGEVFALDPKPRGSEIRLTDPSGRVHVYHMDMHRSGDDYLEYVGLDPFA